MTAMSCFYYIYDIIEQKKEGHFALFTHTYISKKTEQL